MRFQEIKTGQGSKFFQSRNLICYTREQVKREERKSSNDNNTLFIYSSSASLEPFPMLRCTIRISSHDLTHHQLDSLSIQPRHIIQCRNTTVPFVIVINYTATISLLPARLPMSPPFRNTIPCAPFITSFRHSQLLPYLLAP